MYNNVSLNNVNINRRVRCSDTERFMWDNVSPWDYLGSLFEYSRLNRAKYTNTG